MSSGSRRFPQVVSLVSDVARDMSLAVRGVVVGVGIEWIPAISNTYDVATVLTNFLGCNTTVTFSEKRADWSTAALEKMFGGGDVGVCLHLPLLS